MGSAQGWRSLCWLLCFQSLPPLSRFHRDSRLPKFRWAQFSQWWLGQFCRVSCDFKSIITWLWSPLFRGWTKWRKPHLYSLHRWLQPRRWWSFSRQDLIWEQFCHKCWVEPSSWDQSWSWLYHQQEQWLLQRHRYHNQQREQIPFWGWQRFRWVSWQGIYWLVGKLFWLMISWFPSKLIIKAIWSQYHK